MVTTAGYYVVPGPQGTELDFASIDVLTLQIIWRGRTEMTRKGKPREAFAALQSHRAVGTDGTLWAVPCAMVLETYPAHSSI